MAYDGWIEFNGVELVNLSRTTQLAEALGIDTVWTDPSSVAWIEDALGGSDYDVITNAPWYDSGYPASAEFAGIIPLSITGLDDSTLESTPIEYVTDGGNSGRARNKTLALPANVAIVASTDRGAEFGKRWLDRVLRGGNERSLMFCSGSDLRYFRFAQQDGPVPPVAHRRDVSLTRGTSVTRKRSTNCSVTWLTTFTWTAADPYEYGEEAEQLAELGGAVEGPAVVSSGSIALVYNQCPQFDYSPIYDPLYPALVEPPTVPDFFPAGWTYENGATMDRFWARINPVEPSALYVVPVVTITTEFEARMVRVAIWDADSEEDVQCDPLWSAVVSYIPAGLQFIIDGEQKASYAWDGSSEMVRRTDSLVFGPDAAPIKWSSFNDNDNLLVTLDYLTDSQEGDEGNGTVRVALSLVPKSD